MGLNETFLTQEPTPEMAARVRDAVGSSISTVETWQVLWEASGLRERVVTTYQIDPRREIRDRMQWIGWRWVLGGFARLFRLYTTNRATRQALREQFNAPADLLRQMGYALFGGSK